MKITPQVIAWTIGFAGTTLGAYLLGVQSLPSEEERMQILNRNKSPADIEESKQKGADVLKHFQGVAQDKSWLPWSSSK